jgi:hypothetical protein
MEHYASAALLSRPLGTSTKERKNKKLSTTTSSPKVRRKKEEKQRKKVHLKIQRKEKISQLPWSPRSSKIAKI